MLKMKYLLILLLTCTLSAAHAQLQKGDMAPEIVLNDINGNELKLSSLKGKVVLIDFWAAWCKPCRKENPEIVRMYNKYKDESFDNGEGFTVLSVSLDKKLEHWQRAINKDGLIWASHVSDLKGWRSAAAKAYGISAIPQSYLIDGDGEIIALNPRGERLEKELKKIADSSSLFESWFGW